MARDTTDQTPISSAQELIDYLAEGCKPVEKFRIGTEHEKFAFFRDGNKPVPYFGDASISALLKGMQAKLGWEPIIDEGNIIGLSEPSGMGAISIEPGGQFELSGAPLETLHETCKESNRHLATVREIAEPMGIRFLGIGGSPLWTLDETPQMPKSRYAIMTRYMPKVGTQGLDMMYRTCTIQVNLDFSSEEDMRRKMRVSMKLQSRHRAVCLLALYRGKAERAIVLARRYLARYRQPPFRRFYPYLRGGFRLPALCRVGAGCADVFHRARWPIS